MVDPEADVLLSHFSPDGQDNNGLTRRLSGRHAIIRRSQQGFEIEDVSRYGLLLDGVWPGKHKPVPLRLGMRIELSASIKGIVVLSVTALLAHGVILHRIDHGARAECFYLLLPDTQPTPASHLATPQASCLPVLFRRHGGFWRLDTASGKETSPAPATALDKLSGFARHTASPANRIRNAGSSAPKARALRSVLTSDTTTPRTSRSLTGHEHEKNQRQPNNKHRFQRKHEGGNLQFARDFHGDTSSKRQTAFSIARPAPITLSAA